MTLKYENSGRHLSMDAPLVEGEDSNIRCTAFWRISNPDRELIHELRTEIERSLETLTPERLM
jgi:hypothetical protein